MTDWISLPWGRHRDVHHEAKVVVRIVEIHPGMATGLRKHYQRELRWTLLSGRGYAEWDGASTGLIPGRTFVTAAESIYCVRNSGLDNLVLLEIQIGANDPDDVVFYDSCSGEPSQEYVCDTCSSVWEPAALHANPAARLFLKNVRLCPHCRAKLVPRAVGLPLMEPALMQGLPPQDRWCGACGVQVFDDEGPCPRCEADLEIVATDKPPCASPVAACAPVSQPIVPDIWQSPSQTWWDAICRFFRRKAPG